MNSWKSNNYIEKILMLEKKVGHKTKYEILAPFFVNHSDIIGLQEAAHKIAEFIELKNYIFIVTISKQDENVGGHIELKNKEKEVFIEISKDVTIFDYPLLGTLAHEITHKYLEVNDIMLADKKENEILTDIATIFLGLGKLMLNGCYYEDIPDAEGNQKKLRIGYLDEHELAFVYRLICAMRGISREVFLKDLGYRTTENIKKCEKKYVEYFIDTLKEPECRKIIYDALIQPIKTTQSNLFNVEKGLIYLKNLDTSEVEYFLQKKHKAIAKLFKECNDIINEGEHDPCMKYLNSLHIINKFEDVLNELDATIQNAKRFYDMNNKIINQFNNLYPKYKSPKVEMFKILTCHSCGAKLNVPTDKKKILIKCPKCKYNFMVDTSSDIDMEFEKINKKQYKKQIQKAINKK